MDVSSEREGNGEVVFVFWGYLLFWEKNVIFFINVFSIEEFLRYKCYFFGRLGEIIGN